MLLDEFIPEHHFNEVHSIRVPAPPEEVFRAVKEVRIDEIRLFRLLLGLRNASPGMIVGRRKYAELTRRPFLDVATERDFVMLGEEAGREVVLGITGKFWGGGRPIRVGPEGFRGFTEPDYAKAAINFRVEAGGGGSRVITETRVVTTSPSARRKFRLYWILIRPGSGFIRRQWLRAIRRRAVRERTASVSPAAPLGTAPSRAKPHGTRSLR